ncbi:hypothetical protein EMIHUDRAFT_441140 [Emiliania huxleyi CCMP1516]|uniref:Dephospho-CoA kinase n=5 Tax=Emiliania huxleyi TaxID=2903 RepID=A0A0D3KGJ1_EMIH1|nr:hypothetical protein EMIHUDRAFT_441140 [Emiliania huxleyi CCMP1516]EOD34876.1 hypothetical protein EMIHUDRAFT_441140 [Emiliania huxleyi CCMP1516]|eukprot:XP_005787305.1 hypothetical protein EMIHUDRAFT_441140 [Emiliania huxleyi CCMP1516]
MAGLAAIAAAGVGARIPARSSTATVVGLTGGIGMGKSSAAAWFRRCGFRVHDADATVHSLYAAGGAAVEPVCAAFPSARGADGGIDRAALSAAVATAGREASLQRLEEIVHPLVTEERAGFVRRAGEEGEWLVVVDVPLLLETLRDEAALRAQVDVVLLVSCSAAEQRRRCLARPGMSEPKLESILARQLPDADKRARADFVVDTGLSSGVAETRAQLARFVESVRASQPDRWGGWLRQPRACPARGGGRAGGGGGSVACITFDLDETCWPTMPPIDAARRAMEPLLAEAMPRSHESGALASLGGAFRALREERPLIAHDMLELRAAALSRVAEEHGEALSSQQVAALGEAFITARSQTGDHLFTDVAGTVARLRAAGYVVGAITDGNADVARDALTAPLFDFAITAADAGCHKGSMPPFLMAAQAAGCHVSQLARHSREDPPS